MDLTCLALAVNHSAGPNVIPHGVRCEGLLRVLSWVSFDLPAQLKRTLSALLQAAGEGCQSLQDIEIEGRDVRDPRVESEQACSRSS